MNHQYAKSPLETLLDDLSAATGYQHTLGDYEASRLGSQRPSIVWRHPIDRPILSASTLTQRNHDRDDFVQADETIEMIVVAADYGAAVWIMCETWRLGFHARTRTFEGRAYQDSIDFGNVRRGREGEFSFAPKGSFVLVDTITLRWGVPSQEPLYATAETIATTAKLYDGTTLMETVTS